MQRSYITMFLVAALGACAADSGDEGIFITKNVVPEMGCTFTSSETSPFLSHGTFSVSSPIPYQLHPQMKSRVTARAGQEDQRTIIVQGARVEVTFADTTLFTEAELAEMRTQGITRFETRFTAPLPPGAIADGAVDMLLPSLLDRIVAKRPGITDAGAESFRTEVLASVTVFGEMAGDEVTSQPFAFPVTVCNDCVTNILGACPLPVGTTTRTGNACNPYQDGVSDCCVSGGEVVCPGTVSTL